MPMQGHSGDMIDDVDEDMEVRLRRRKRRRRVAIASLGLSTFYYLAAIAYYTQRAVKLVPCPEPAECDAACWAPWDAIDAIYFATVTMTTVGYGDLKPESPDPSRLTELQAITVLFLLFGFIVVFSSISIALAPFYQNLELLFFRLSDFCMRICIGKKADGTLVDLDGARHARALRSLLSDGRWRAAAPGHMLGAGRDTVAVLQCGGGRWWQCVDTAVESMPFGFRRRDAATPTHCHTDAPLLRSMLLRPLRLALSVCHTRFRSVPVTSCPPPLPCLPGVRLLRGRNGRL